MSTADTVLNLIHNTAMTYIEIGRKLGITSKSVSRIARDNGVPKKRNATAWPAEMEVRGKELWESQKYTASVIAILLNEEFGTCRPLTKNAIIGKARRKKWNGSCCGDRQLSITIPSPSVKHIIPVQYVPEPNMGEGVSLVDLEPHHCRWPVDMKENENTPHGVCTRFCGAPRMWKPDGMPSSFCEHHHSRAYQNELRKQEAA